MTFVFKHPKYYKELRSRNKALRSCDAYSKENSNYTERQQSGQAISNNDGLAQPVSVRPGQGHKLQAASNKPQASSLKQQAASDKLQAPSDSSNKPQASSPKQQASSFKPQAASSKILEPR